MKLFSTLTAIFFFCLSSFAQTSINIQYENTRDTIGIVYKPDQKVKYPGGMKGWLQFVNKNIDMRKSVWDMREQHIKEETAIVQFVVCADGTVCEAVVINDVLPSVKKEVLCLIKKSGKWIPAQKDGIAVKAYHKQPFTFVNTQWEPAED